MSLHVMREPAGTVRCFDSFALTAADELAVRITASSTGGISLSVHDETACRRCALHGLSVADARLLAAELIAAAEALTR